METIRNIFCVGRNYVAHVEELKNEVPTEPLFFMKPTHAAAFVETSPVIQLPKDQGAVHHEIELVVQLQQDYDCELPLEELVGSVCLGLDLTLRDVQSIAKQQGLPWLAAKGFRNSAVLSQEVAFRDLNWWQQLHFHLLKNGQMQQASAADCMIYPLPELLAFCHQHYGLKQGDILFTGTPAGVGPLHAGDALELYLEDQLLGSLCVE